MIERLYPMSAVLNDKGQSNFYGKVGGAGITGNEDGIKYWDAGSTTRTPSIGPEPDVSAGRSLRRTTAARRKIV